MTQRRSLNTHGFGWHVFALGSVVLIAAIVGVLAGEVEAAVFMFGVGAIGFLLGVTLDGRTRSGTIAHESRLRHFVWGAVVVALLSGISAAIERAFGDHAAAWGAGVAAIGALIVGITLVLARSYQLSREKRESSRDASI